MDYNKNLLSHKLDRWVDYLTDCALPDWADLPNIGLYMDQVIALLTNYLDFLPNFGGEERPITPTTINNYVRLRVMPAPERRKYYRVHIAFLIVIFTMKQSVSIPSIQKVLPASLEEEAVQAFYQRFVARFSHVGHTFAQVAEKSARSLPLNTQEEAGEIVEDLLLETILTAGCSRLFAERLLSLRGRTLEEVRALEAISANAWRNLYQEDTEPAAKAVNK